MKCAFCRQPAVHTAVFHDGERAPVCTGCVAMLVQLNDYGSGGQVIVMFLLGLLQFAVQQR